MQLIQEELKNLNKENPVFLPKLSCLRGIFPQCGHPWHPQFGCYLPPSDANFLKKSSQTAHRSEKQIISGQELSCLHKKIPPENDKVENFLANELGHVTWLDHSGYSK